MNQITVTASTSYKVYINSGLLSQIGKFVADLHDKCQVAVITDTNVWPLYGKIVQTSLEQAGFCVFSYVFPAGEDSKNGNTYLQILDYLAQNRINRSDLLIALGGGVVGDITGFAAATFLRGIPFIQIPTTLLAMVDSSVGGKTAIDLPSGKNLAGTFYQPSCVLCDPSLLNTLPADIFLDGCAEVIKYGILYDEALFSHLLDFGVNFDRQKVITRCIELKRNVVCEDEFDRGERQKLNLGHTIAHGIEANSQYTISHGRAVAAGIGIITRAASANGICSPNCAKKVMQILDRFSLPANTGFTSAQLYESALSDKKRASSHVNLIVPRKIGDCIILPTEVSVLQHFIESGLVYDEKTY